ncbi:hypothetical protein P7D86_08305, partial [Enterococcus avium]|nr:hypothetical protein [Enterococcus avium]
MNFIAMDFETANYQTHSACSLALVMVKNSQIVGEYYSYYNIFIGYKVLLIPLVIPFIYHVA